jgi:hypothetical protein
LKTIFKKRKKGEYLYIFSILKSMFKVLITITLILILTTSILSQAEAKGVGGFRGGSFGGGFGGKSFSSNSIPMGTGQGKMFTTSPSGKINPQETTQQGPKQTASSSPTSSSGSSSNNPQNNFKSQPSSSPQSPFQQQPRSNFFGGGFGGGLGGFGNMIMASIMGNFIGQALFGWMLPHPTPVAAPAPTQSSSVTPANNGTSNNQAKK